MMKLRSLRLEQEGFSNNSMQQEDLHYLCTYEEVCICFLDNNVCTHGLHWR